MIIRLLLSLAGLGWFLHSAAEIQRENKRRAAALRRLDIWQGCRAGCTVCTIGCEKHSVEYINFEEEK